MPGWQRGDPMLLREIYLGRIWAIRPVRMVEETPERVAVFLAAGTRWLRPVHPDGTLMRIQDTDWRVREADWIGNSAIRIWKPGRPHSVLAWWDPVTWEFRGWYVNFEDPMRPTPLGYDYLDMALDIVVRPDRTWSWKDEDEFDEAQSRGILSAALADAIRRDAALVIADIEAGAPPFDDVLPAWRPDPSWKPLGLPADFGPEPMLRWDEPTRAR